MRRSLEILSIMVIALTLLLGMATLYTVKAQMHPMIRYYEVKGQVYSLNWAGYAVPAEEYTVTGVAGSFIVPQVTCTKQTTYVALWAGIDGYNDSTVEQAGILAECSGGKAYYSAWYEFYPSPSVTISGFTVKPGDHIYVSVAYLGNGEFNITLIDYTEHETFSTTGSVSGALLSSAECILERPTVAGQLTALANFGTAYFGQDYTGIQGTCYATISGSTKSFGSFNSVTEIVMVTNSGKVLAQPSSLSSDGSSFTVAYISSK